MSRGPVKAPTVWARSPRGIRHAIIIDELGHVSECGGWRPAPHDVRDGDGPRCPSCVTMAAHVAEPHWRKHGGSYYQSRSADIAVKLGAGTPGVEIAAELGVSLDLVHKVAQRLRTKAGAAKLTLTDRVRAMAKAHPTWLWSAIARECGTTSLQVAKVLGGVS